MILVSKNDSNLLASEIFLIFVYCKVHTDFGDLPYNTTSRPNRLDVMLPGWQKFPIVMTSYYPANWGTL
jgi:hypothetical protein